MSGALISRVCATGFGKAPCASRVKGETVPRYLCEGVPVEHRVGHFKQLDIAGLVDAAGVDLDPVVPVVVGEDADLADLRAR